MPVRGRSSSPARSGHAPCNGPENPAKHCVQSVVSGILSDHPFPQFRGPSATGLPWAVSRSRESTVVPVAAQPRLPGQQNCILPGFPQSCHSRSALGLADRAGQFFSQPESGSITCPSLAPPSEPADWTATYDVTRLRVSGNQPITSLAYFTNWGSSRSPESRRKSWEGGGGPAGLLERCGAGIVEG